MLAPQLLLHHGDQFVRRLDDDEEDHSGRDEKANQRADDGTDVELEERHDFIHLLFSAIGGFS